VSQKNRSQEYKNVKDMLKDKTDENVNAAIKAYLKNNKDKLQNLKNTNTKLDNFKDAINELILKRTST